MSLRIGPELVLPKDAVTQTFGILAVRGAGKSNTAAVMAEEMHDAGLPFCAIDPVGSWWGLRSSADGKGAGLPIPIFGGEHGDVPLERGSGELLADLVADKSLSCVVDLSSFESEAAKKAFLLAFAVRLYRRNRNPLHLFLEEADDYIPQRPMRDEAHLLRAWENIVRRGRARGLGLTLITQRSASLNKNVLTQVETLFAMRTTGPQDRNAIEEWVKYHAASRELLASLPELADGEAWCWSPHWLGKMVRVKVRRRRTFDSGATPKHGGARRAATLADVDLPALQEEWTTTIEKAKADDPKALRARIAELEKQLRGKPAAAPKVERVEVPMLSKEESAALRAIAMRLERQEKDVAAVVQGCQGTANLFDRLRRHLEAPPREPPRRPIPALESPPKPTLREKAARHLTNGAASEVGHGGLRRIMVALAQRPQGLTNRQIGVRAGLSSRSGTFSTYISRARSAGWIEGAGTVRITDAGVDALGAYEPLPTGAGLASHWLGELGSSGAARILRALIDAYPRALTHERVGELADISPRSGTYSTYVSRLRSLELIEGRSELRASEELFA